MKVLMSMMISDWWGWWGFCSSERWGGELIAGVSCADLELPTLAQPVFIFPMMMILTNNNSLPTLPILRFYKSVSLRTHLMSFLDILMLMFNTCMGRDFQSLSLSSEIGISNFVSKKMPSPLKRLKALIYRKRNEPVLLLVWVLVLHLPGGLEVVPLPVLFSMQEIVCEDSYANTSPGWWELWRWWLVEENNCQGIKQGSRMGTVYTDKLYLAIWTLY